MWKLNKVRKIHFFIHKTISLDFTDEFLERERNIFYDPDPECPGTDQCIWSLIMRPGAVLILSIVSMIH